jgi:hypothetical protein
MMNLTGIHLLLSYCCTYECDHCFLWSSPHAKGTMTLAQVDDILHQAQDLGGITTIYFEGGEPFLFYPIMLQGLRMADRMGFRTGIVTNCYWATSVEDAALWLEPIAEVGVADLSLSSDLFHGEAMLTQDAKNAIAAAQTLGLPESVISIEVPEGCSAYATVEKGAPITGGPVRFRGRAVAKLAEGVSRSPWTQFTACHDEDFVNPGRVHVDALGNVHICQGVIMGNLWHQPLAEIVASYHPASHPIIGPLAEGGPVALVEHYHLPHQDSYIDACHLCYMARDTLRSRFAAHLGPAQVYGE